MIKEILKELREITKNKKSWKVNIDDVASKLDELEWISQK